MGLRVWRSRSTWLMASLLLLAGCSGSDDDTGDDDSTQNGDDDTSSTSTPAVAPRVQIDSATESTDPDEHGVYLIKYTIYGAPDVAFDIKPTYSVSNTIGSWQVPSRTADSPVLSPLTGSAEGIQYTFKWDSLKDIGYKTYSKVWLHFDGTAGSDVVLATQTYVIDGLDNSKWNTPCVIHATVPSQTDGQIPLEYTLEDEAGDTQCTVTILVQAQGGQPNPITVSASGVSDPLSGFTLEPGKKVTRHFVWDSAADIGAVNRDVTLQFKADDGNQPSQEDVPFQVTNDPVPGPGQVIFSEVMFWTDYTNNTYVELYNTANHDIELKGVWLESTNPSSVQILPASGSLLIAAKGYAVLAQALDDNFTVDWTFGSFLMKRSSGTLTLWTGDVSNQTILDKIAYNVETLCLDGKCGGDAVRGHSMAVANSFLSAQGNDDNANLCLETTPLPGSVAGAQDYGSPGIANICTPPVP